MTISAATLTHIDQTFPTRLRMTILRAGRRLRSESAGSLSEGQVSVLATLFVGGPLSAGALAEREHVRPPTMTRTLNFLHGEGYLTRESDPSDRRCVLIGLSPRGEEYVTETRRRRDEWLQHRLDGLSGEELAILTRAEEILRRVVDR